MIQLNILLHVLLKLDLGIFLKNAQGTTNQELGSAILGYLISANNRIIFGHFYPMENKGRNVHLRGDLY